MDDRIRNSFDKMNPSQEQSERMLKKIMEAQAENAPRRTQGFRRMAATFALVCGLTLTCGVAYASGVASQLVDVVSSIFTKNQEIIDEALHEGQELTATYASEILYMDQQYLVFANLRGLILYDYQRDTFVGTVDLQELGCIYLEEGEIQTRALVDGDKLIVFNEKEGALSGDYYQFQIAMDGASPLTLVNQGSDGAAVSAYQAQLAKKNATRVDTFWYFEKNEQVMKLLGADNSSNPVIYSQFAYPFKESGTALAYHFLLLEKERYNLCSVDAESGTVTRKELALATSGNRAEDASGIAASNDLPAFNCSLNDPIEDAICEYMRENYWNAYYPENSYGVCFPAFDIVKVEEKDGETVVWGIYGTFSFTRVDKILENTSGGYSHGLMHIRNGKVVYAEMAGDGRAFVEAIERFADGDADLYQAMLGSEESVVRTQDKLLDTLRQYVKENKLDVEYVSGLKQDIVTLESDS